jgi:predicted nucleic-acid-binding protein
LIGVEANVLLRHILGDDPVWSEKAAYFLRNYCSPERTAFVNPVALAEVMWVLRRRPGSSREKLSLVVENFLADEHLTVGSRPAVVEALDAFRKGPAGFVDYLVAALNTDAGAIPTFTIDRKALKRTPFASLP